MACVPIRGDRRWLSVCHCRRQRYEARGLYDRSLPRNERPTLRGPECSHLRPPHPRGVEGLRRRTHDGSGRSDTGLRTQGAECCGTPPTEKASSAGCFPWWRRAESNRRHADFQSAALPTELPRHAFRPPEWKPDAGAEYGVSRRRRQRTGKSGLPLPEKVRACVEFPAWAGSGPGRSVGQWFGPSIRMDSITTLVWGRFVLRSRSTCEMRTATSIPSITSPKTVNWPSKSSFQSSWSATMMKN